MERKTRILFALLTCVLTALPIAAKPGCSGFIVYATGPEFYAPDPPTALTLANQSCRSLWMNASAYAASLCFEDVQPLANTNYHWTYKCLRCKDYPGPWHTSWPLDAQDAIEKALTVQPGTARGAMLGEVIVDETTSKLVYHVDISQGDLTIRVDVDAETGEVTTPPPGDPIDQ